MNATSKPRLEIVDVMQGLAMILVIVGHHLLEFMPDVYGTFHSWLYTFHMPYFILISGFLIAYSWKGETYWKYVLKRLKKFFIPYVVIGLIITLLSGVINGGGWLSNLLYLVISPKQSEATFLWYIYLLFVFYAIFPLIHKVHQQSKFFDVLLIAAGALLFIYPVHTQLFCLDYFTRYFIFYILGIEIALWLPELREKLSKTAINVACCGALICFAGISYLYFKADSSMKFAHYLYQLIAFFAIGGLCFISVLLARLPSVKRALVWVSRNCFHIYLLHMFFVQGLAFAFAHFLHLALGPFEATVYIAVSSVVSMLGATLTFKVLDVIKHRVFHLT